MRLALISVTDKTLLADLAKTLIQFDIHLIASTGTANYLQEQGYDATSISDFAQFYPLLEGRVKTLHPKIFAGILADRANNKHMQELSDQDFPVIDFVIVDLYPFEQERSIENIDIGGISLIRAAAKNYQYCTVISNMQESPLLIANFEANKGITDLDFRKTMAINAFARSSKYDANIHDWLAQKQNVPLGLDKSISLAYGENPHQAADFFNFPKEQPSITQIQGKALSYNNILDLDAGIKTVEGFQENAAVVIKHTNPCGAALANTVFDAVKKAYYADAKSAFGGIVVLNTPLTQEAALFLNQYFFELIAAPDFCTNALSVLAKKPSCRIIQYQKNAMHNKEIKSALNGLLIQEKDKPLWDWDDFIIPTKLKPSEALMPDLCFAFNIATQVKSNAIVIAKEGATLSLCGGQSNRVDAAKIALSKLHSQDLTNAVLASDGFFPFTDTIELLANTPIKTIIQPGGSKRDAEVIAACDELKISMVFTQKRGFKH